MATDKKMNPDNSVPRPTITVDAIKLVEIFLNVMITAKKAKPVISLSAIFERGITNIENTFDNESGELTAVQNTK